MSIFFTDKYPLIWFIIDDSSIKSPANKIIVKIPILSWVLDEHRSYFLENTAHSIGSTTGALFPPQGTFCMDEQYENIKQRYKLQPPPKEKATEVAEMGRNAQENSLAHHMAGTPSIVWLWIPEESRKGSLVIAEWTLPACWIVLILQLCKTFLIYKPQHWWISDMILKMWVHFHVK